MATARHPKESDAYRKVRDELQQAEIALRDQRERVAELRRSLPLDTQVEDFVFEEIRDGERVPVRLSELFEEADKPLVLMHFMYGKKQGKPCPMCTMWADGYDGAIPHLRQRVNFAVLVAGDIAVIGAYGRTRGWRHLRFVSAAESDIKRQLEFETPDGAQHPGVSIFTRGKDGTLTHTYSQSAYYGGEEYRGMDLLSPVWHFFDLTPQGRGDFFPQRSY
jgi:predicted dithiol-disulfide oxidoreductase (DUF899 family)